MAFHVGLLIAAFTVLLTVSILNFIDKCLKYKALSSSSTLPVIDVERLDAWLREVRRLELELELELEYRMSLLPVEPVNWKQEGF